MSRGPVTLALGTQVVIGAATYLVAKSAMGAFSPFEIALLRFAGSSALFAGLLMALPPPRLPRRGELVWIALLGLLGAPLNQGFFLSGLRSTSPIHAALLYALSPVVILLVARVLGHERTSRAKIVGIALAFAGVAIVLLGRGWTGEREALSGDVLISLGVLSWAVYTVLGRRMAQVHGPIRTTSWTMIAGSLLSLPAAPFVVRLESLSSAPGTAWGAVLFLVVLTSFVSYLLWYYALSRIEASKVAVWSNLQPVLTAAMAWALWGTPVTAALAVGGVLVIGGVALTQRG